MALWEKRCREFCSLTYNTDMRLTTLTKIRRVSHAGAQYQQGLPTTISCTLDECSRCPIHARATLAQMLSPMPIRNLCEYIYAKVRQTNSALVEGLLRECRYVSRLACIGNSEGFCHYFAQLYDVAALGPLKNALTSEYKQ
ncbi:hypothetical protein EV182_007558, partial [Spiromyces aspiralis]